MREYRDDIRQAIEVMNKGGVILYPTDTIWGIGCDATNEAAVRRVFEIKKRADAKALITLVDSEAKLEFYVNDIPEVAWDLIEVAERPLTIILIMHATWLRICWLRMAVPVFALPKKSSARICVCV